MQTLSNLLFPPPHLQTGSVPSANEESNPQTADLNETAVLWFSKTLLVFTTGGTMHPLQSRASTLNNV